MQWNVSYSEYNFRANLPENFNGIQLPLAITFLFNYFLIIKPYENILRPTPRYTIFYWLP